MIDDIQKNLSYCFCVYHKTRGKFLNYQQSINSSISIYVGTVCCKTVFFDYFENIAHPTDEFVSMTH